MSVHVCVCETEEEKNGKGRPKGRGQSNSLNQLVPGRWRDRCGDITGQGSTQGGWDQDRPGAGVGDSTGPVVRTDIREN